MKLSPKAEEVATFFAKMLDHEYTTKDIFRKNFFKDWRKVGQIGSALVFFRGLKTEFATCLVIHYSVYHGVVGCLLLSLLPH